MPHDGDRRGPRNNVIARLEAAISGAEGMMSNVVSLYDFARRHRAITPPAETNVAETGVDAARSASGNWHTVVAGFEQMRDSLDVLGPAMDARGR
jgi:hypothetical protein